MSESPEFQGYTQNNLQTAPREKGEADCQKRKTKARLRPLRRGSPTTQELPGRPRGSRGEAPGRTAQTGEELGMAHPLAPAARHRRLRPAVRETRRRRGRGPGMRLSQRGRPSVGDQLLETLMTNAAARVADLCTPHLKPRLSPRPFAPVRGGSLVHPSARSLWNPSWTRTLHSQPAPAFPTSRIPSLCKAWPDLGTICPWVSLLLPPYSNVQTDLQEPSVAFRGVPCTEEQGPHSLPGPWGPHARSDSTLSLTGCGEPPGAASPGPLPLAVSRALW